MDLQALVNKFKIVAGVYAFDILPDGCKSDIRIMAINDFNTMMFRKRPDAPDFYQNVTSDPEVNRFLTWENDKSVADTEELMKEFIRRYDDPERYCWAIPCGGSLLFHRPELVGPRHHSGSPAESHGFPV